MTLDVAVVIAQPFVLAAGGLVTPVIASCTIYQKRHLNSISPLIGAPKMTSVG
jgi:hypothetical protein